MISLPRTSHLISRLNQFFADHIDPDGIQPLQALRTTIAGIFAIVLYHALPWSQAYWVLLSTIIILQTYAGDTPKQKVLTLLITTVSATICTYIASRLCFQPLALAVFLFISTFISLYFYTFNNISGNVAIYVNLFCLSAGALAVDATNSFQRTIAVALGGIVALVVCLCFWPERLSHQIRDTLEKILYRLGDFNYALLERADDNKAVTTRRNRFIRGMQLANQRIPSNEVQAKEIVNNVEYFYEILLNLHQLRRYLQEQQVLRFLYKELTIILRRSSWLLFSAAYQLHQSQFIMDIHKFIRVLRTFENLYERRRHQLTEEQLLAFIIYIDSMHKLKKSVTELIALLQQKYHSL